MKRLNVGSLGWEVKDFFVDRPLIKKLLKDASLDVVLPKAGAYLRTVARNSMTRKGMARRPWKTEKQRARMWKEARERPPSKPGSPPNIHTSNDSVSLKNVQFAVDPSTVRMLCGPVMLPGGRVNPTVPELMEHGGVVQLKGKKGTGVYPPRPIMGPALAAAVASGKIPSMLTGVVKVR